MYAFVPKPLEIEGRPELSNFSLNILIWEVTGNVHSHYLYEPDFSTYLERDDNQYLLYRGHQQDKVELEDAINASKEEISYMLNEIKNPKNRGIVIRYTKSTGTWYGKAVRGKEQVGEAFGTDWHGFFLHLAQIFHK